MPVVIPVLVVVVVVVVAAATILHRSRVRHSETAQLRSLCCDATVIVDLITPANGSTDAPTTGTLTDSIRRLAHLEDRLARVPGRVQGRVAEAVGDLGRVGRSLAGALEAERSLRISGAETAERVQSADRIASRAAELDLAADELMWLVEVDT